MSSAVNGFFGGVPEHAASKIRPAPTTWDDELAAAETVVMATGVILPPRRVLSMRSPAENSDMVPRLMTLADRLGQLLPMPRLDARRNVIRDAWNLLSRVPGGRVLFDRLVGRLAPYTGSIHARVIQLRDGYGEVT